MCLPCGGTANRVPGAGCTHKTPGPTTTHVAENLTGLTVLSEEGPGSEFAGRPHVRIRHARAAGWCWE